MHPPKRADTSSGTVEIPRATLRESERAARTKPPLLRGEISKSVDEEFIELPVPVAPSEQADEICVLQVDDDPAVMDLTKSCLERIDDDIAVTTTTSVVAALDWLGDGEFDCIISDYEMPNTTGIEFLEIVREQYPDVPFILFTGKGSEEVASEAIAAGVTDYMQKSGGVDQYEVLANRIEIAVEQYRTQQQFWDALTWYQRLVEQDLAGVFIVQDGTFVYVNGRLAEMFGYSQSELIGEPPRRIAGDEEDTIGQVVDRNCTTDGSFKDSFSGQRADGTAVPVEIHGGRIQYEGEPGCIGILWDHRDRAESEQT
jgi:PAS domain S-box-containing protein